MANLFTRGGLQQGSGLLNERWAQQGSVLVNAGGAYGGDNTVHTVTAGKVCYIKTVYIGSTNGQASPFYLRDGNGGSVKLRDVAPASGDYQTIVFDVPLKFETSVYYDEYGTGSVDLTVSGWEEQPD